MSNKRKQKGKPAIAAAPAQPYTLWLWLVFFAGALVFLPWCLDRYLAPRFFFLSVVLFGAFWILRRHWQALAGWRLNPFDLLLIAWYGLNVASVFWAFSRSEGIFYAQKVLLLLAVYWLVRMAWLHDATALRLAMARVTQALTLIVSVVLVIQLGLAISEHGLDNQHLYDYASGVFGNKGLAADFLFFLLLFNLLFEPEFKNRRLFWTSLAILLLLLLVLQTRTVYLALAAGGLVYFGLRIVSEPEFRPVFLKKILPAGLLGLAVLASLIAWKGRGSSLAERLNPATYLESASAIERRFVWYKTDLLNQEYVWLGVGNGSWKFLFPSKNIEGAYRLQEKNIVMTRAHNDYLEVRAEMGLIGVALFILLFGAAFIVGTLASFRAETPGIRRNLAVLLSGLAGYCVIQYFDFPRERIELQAILAFLFASLVFYSRPIWDKVFSIELEQQKSIFLGLILVGLAFNALAGWKRMQGEIHTVQTLQAQSKGNYPAMLHEAAAASNTFYEYNDVGLPLAWYEGIAHYQMNQVPESVAAFERAYRLNPWAFQVINNYGSALVRAQQFDRAIALFEQAVTINPRYDEGKFNIAYCLYAKGQYDSALDWLGRVDTIPNPQTSDERAKNRTVLEQKVGLENAIRERQ